MGKMISRTDPVILQAGNSLGYNILSQTTNTLITNAIFGQKTELSDIFGIVAGASMGSILPKYKALNAKPLVNTLAETGYNTVRGAATGAVRGGIDAIIHKDARYIYQDAIGGAISGGVKTLMNNLIFGAPFVRKESYGVDSYHRSGGLASLLSLGAGLTMGNNCWIYNRNSMNVPNHEDYHVIQQGIIEEGWANFYARIVYEYIKYGFNGSYKTEGTLEYWADQYESLRKINRGL